MLFFEYAAALIGILTFIGGIVAWYRGAVQKAYASQRDWEHVKNNQRELVQNLNFLFKELDSRLDRIDSQNTELKGMLYALLRRRNDDD